MANKIFSALMIGFILAIVGIALASVVADSLKYQQEASTSLNELHSIATAVVDDDDINESVTFTVTYYPNKASTTQNLPIESFVLRNYNGSTATDTTDYVVNETAGTYTLVNTSFWVNSIAQTNGNNSYTNYTYYSYDYIVDSPSRSIVGLILIFVVLGLVLYIALPIIKDAVNLTDRIGR